MAWATLLGAVSMTVGCGGSSSPATAPPSGTPSTASADERAAIVAVINAYEVADTPEALCATISRGLESAIEAHGGAPTVSKEEAPQSASANCPDVISKAKDAGEFQLVRTKSSVSTVMVQGARAAALVDEAGLKRPYFLFNNSDHWLIINYGSSPPDFRDLADSLGS